MNDLGRRYFLFASTKQGKQRVLGTMIAVACVLNILASTYGQSHAHSRTVGIMFGVSVGLLGVALIFLFTNRRAK